MQVAGQFFSKLITVFKCFGILSGQRTVTYLYRFFPPDLWDGFDFLVTFQINEFSFVMLQMQSFQETSNLVDKMK